MKSKSMMDCMDLVTNEIGLENLGKAILWTDNNYDNEWVNLLNKIDHMITDAKYGLDENYRNEISTMFYNRLYFMISRYKHEAFSDDKKIKSEFENLFANSKKV